MRDLNHVGRGQMEQSDMDEHSNKNGMALNFDVQSYRFHDLDLAMAVKKLPEQDQAVLVLYLMGHTQNTIAGLFSLSRSMISKRLTAIRKDLARRLN